MWGKLRKLTQEAGDSAGRGGSSTAGQGWSGCARQRGAASPGSAVSAGGEDHSDPFVFSTFPSGGTGRAPADVPPNTLPNTAELPV